MRMREEMVATQLVARGINDPRVLGAFREVPREAFVPSRHQGDAYEDRPLPIGHGQTISQPYMVALMTQELRLTAEHHVLEIGTGSGYQTAILAVLCRRVFTVERIVALSERAKERLSALGLANVRCKVGDGTLGWGKFAPSDRIVVTAGAPEVPRALLNQLATNGIIVIPVGNRGLQDLQVGVKADNGIQWRSSCACRFVKLIGEQGWA